MTDATRLDTYAVLRTEASKYGLILAGDVKLSGKLTFEAAIRINGSALLGNCCIGMGTYIGPGGLFKNVEIGRYCAIGERVQIGPPNHPTDWVSCHPFQYSKVGYFDDFAFFPSGNRRYSQNAKRTLVGNDVWIGTNVVIMQGVTVGTGAVIGANSVVTKDVEPYAVVAGAPAVTKRKRFESEICEGLLSSLWWNKDLGDNDFSYDNPGKFIEELRCADLPDITPPQNEWLSVGPAWELKNLRK
jgi:acetyltransferase-like isoleucine patch superfamily enzyme